MTSAIKTFMDKVAENTELKNKLDALAEMPETERVDAVIAIAKDVGIALTTIDLVSPTDEMDDDELTAVAGGWQACVCVVGGGGKEDADGAKCWCVVSGKGSAHDGQRRCACPAFGVGEYPTDWKDVLL